MLIFLVKNKKGTTLQNQSVFPAYSVFSKLLEKSALETRVKLINLYTQYIDYIDHVEVAKCRE